MATLLESSSEYRSPQRGEIVDGTVMGWDREGLLVDIGAKSEGVVPRQEMQSYGPNPEDRLEHGAHVLAFVVQPEGSDGQILLSLDRARGERGWLTLQERFDSGEIFEAAVTGYNKGGLLVNVEGVNAFVPMSQVVGFRPDRGEGGSSLSEAVGKTLRLKVIEINRRRNRVILSERAALQEWRMEQKERLIQELREGDIRRGRITSVRSFGVFVDLGGADGLAHLSELSWERDKSPADLFRVGDEVDVYITKIDPENKKIALSLRRARPEQWDAIVGKFQEGQVVIGRITKLVTFGAFARIEGPVEGLIHVSELVDRRVAHPREAVREGDLLPLKVVRIEYDRQRLGLSLRRARDEGEALGFVFSDGGEVMSVPDDIRKEFEEREGPPPRRTTDDGAAEGRSEAEQEDAPDAYAGVAPAEEAATPPSAEQPDVEAAEPPIAEQPDAEAAELPIAEQPDAEAAELPAAEQPHAEAAELPAAEQPDMEAAELPIADQPDEQPRPAPETAIDAAAEASPEEPSLMAAVSEPAESHDALAATPEVDTPEMEASDRGDEAPTYSGVARAEEAPAEEPDQIRAG